MNRPGLGSDLLEQGSERNPGRFRCRWFESLSGALRAETRETAHMRLDEGLAELSESFLATGASASTRNVRDATKLCGMQIARLALEFSNLRRSLSTAESPSHA